MPKISTKQAIVSSWPLNNYETHQELRTPQNLCFTFANIDPGLVLVLVLGSPDGSKYQQKTLYISFDITVIHNEV